MDTTILLNQLVEQLLKLYFVQKLSNTKLYLSKKKRFKNIDGRYKIKDNRVKRKRSLVEIEKGLFIYNSKTQTLVPLDLKELCAIHDVPQCNSSDRKYYQYIPPEDVDKSSQRPKTSQAREYYCQEKLVYNTSDHLCCCDVEDEEISETDFELFDCGYPPSTQTRLRCCQRNKSQASGQDTSEILCACDEECGNSDCIPCPKLDKGVDAETIEPDLVQELNTTTDQQTLPCTPEPKDVCGPPKPTEDEIRELLKGIETDLKFESCLQHSNIAHILEELSKQEQEIKEMKCLMNEILEKSKYSNAGCAADIYKRIDEMKSRRDKKTKKKKPECPPPASSPTPCPPLASSPTPCPPPASTPTPCPPPASRQTPCPPPSSTPPACPPEPCAPKKAQGPEIDPCCIQCCAAQVTNSGTIKPCSCKKDKDSFCVKLFCGICRKKKKLTCKNYKQGKR